MSSGSGNHHNYPIIGLSGCYVRSDNTVTMDQQQRHDAGNSTSSFHHQSSSSRPPPVYGNYAAPRLQQQQQLFNMPPNNVQSEQCCAANHNIEVRITQLEKLMMSFIDMYKQNTERFFSQFSEVKECTVKTAERVARIEHVVSKGWADVYDYSEAQQVPNTASAAPFVRRDCNRVTEMSGSGVANNDDNDSSRSRSSSVQVENTNHTDLTEAPGLAYPTSHRGERIIDVSDNDNILSATTTTTTGAITSPAMNRRESNSASTTTIESGYGEDLFDNNNAEQDPSYYNTTTSHNSEHEQEDRSRRTGRSVIKSPPRGEADIEIIDVIHVTPKKSGGLDTRQPGSSGRKENVPSSNGTERIRRRPSLFASSSSRNNNTTLYYDDISDDDNATTNYSQGIRPFLDTPEVGSINDIFEDNSWETASSNEDLSNLPSTSSRPLKRKKSPNQVHQNKRIVGISKAPIKQEPVTVPMRSREQPLPPHTAPQSDIPRPVVGQDPLPSTSLDSTEEFCPERLKNIKIEKVAHAQESETAEDGRYWWCICGHYTETKSGLRSHVKNLGTEEPRYMCRYCERRFIWPFQVKPHMAKEHNEHHDHVWGCPKCYNVFFDKDRLKTHKNERGENCKTASRRSRTNRNEDIPVREEGVPRTEGRPSIVIQLS